jgi:carbon monoxide dehydrogenase subunit G
VATVTVSRHIDRPPAAVWALLSDLERHTDWMGDAEWVVFLGPPRRGVGTVMVARTRYGPIRMDDLMEVVGWVEGHSITVRHDGLVTGTGELRVDPEGAGSRATWTEDLTFPWRLGGPVTAWLAVPVLRRVFRRSLDRLAGLLA